MISMRILLAEDEELSAELLQRILKPIITAFIVTTTLAETLTVANNCEFDIIIFDLRLLDSDIENSIRAIQSLKRTANAPLLVVTGMPDPTLKDRCLEAGADGFIPKQDAYTLHSHVLMLALYTAILHHPRPRGEGFMEKVQILEKLAAA